MGTATWPPRIGPENGEEALGFRVEPGVEPRGRPVGRPGDRPDGREPGGTEESVGGTVGWVPFDRRSDLPAPVTAASATGLSVSHGCRWFWCHPEPAPGVHTGHESVGTHDPWKPNGTRAGRCTVATGGPPNEVASRMTRSLASRVAS